MFAALMLIPMVSGTSCDQRQPSPLVQLLCLARGLEKGENGTW